MQLVDYIGHAYNIIYLIAYALRDILWIRLMVTTAALVQLAYFFMAIPNPWSAAPWILMAIGINGYHSVRLLVEKGTINFNSEERTIHQTVFPTMTLLQFKHLLQIARWHTFGERAEIIKRGVACNDLILLVEGSANVQLDSQNIATLAKNNFAGEMSYLTNQPTTASVVAADTVRCLLWKGDDLRKLMEKEPDLNMALQSVFNKILVKKLADTNVVAMTRAPFQAQ